MIKLTLSLYALAAVMAIGVALLIRVVVAALSRPSPVHSQPSAPAPSAAAHPSAPPPEHIAAITAAVAAVMGPHRIVHIERASQQSSWAISGRSLHHSSHNLARRPRR